MRKSILLFVVVSTFLISSARGENWSLSDPDKGWNSPELVVLYFHNSELQTQWAWEALSQYSIQGNERILDFGSGDGKLSAMMSFMVPNGHVTGVDLSQNMVYFASKMFPYKNLNFVRTDDVNFSDFKEDQKFDLVTSFCVFNVVPNPVAVLKNIRALMKSSGRLVVTLPIGKNREFFLAVSEEMKLRGWDFPPPSSETIKMRTSEGAKEILMESGFEIASLKEMDTRNSFSSKKELVDWFNGTLSANWNIPEDQRVEFFDALAERYLSYRPDEVDDDGFVYFSLKRIDFVAFPKV